MRDAEASAFLLSKAYREAVALRTHRRATPFLKLPEQLIRTVAGRLLDVRLAKVFVDAQFDCMPPKWCMGRFKRPYPPPQVVFGGECWERYEEYVNA